MNKKLIIVLAILVIVAVGIIIAQSLKSKNQVNKIISPALQSQNLNNSTGNNQNKGRNNFMAINGTVIAVGDKSFTVNLDKGGSAIVFYSQTTAVTKNTKMAVADLAVGQPIIVSGTKNAEGVFTAATVMVRETVNGEQEKETTLMRELPNQQNNTEGRGQNNNSEMPDLNRNNNHGFINGQITAVDGTKITVKLPYGNENTIILTNDTKITKTELVTIGDITVGTVISARGTKGTDGSLIAQAITVGGEELKKTMPENHEKMPADNNMPGANEPDANLKPQ